MTAISILVPVYNVERYLTQCLQSIQDQTFQDFEVICINDGSTDHSLTIIEQFSRTDDRFKVINKTNSGYGHSMNTGLEACTGQYIGIVESDDYIEPTMFEKLYQMAIQHDLDIARCSYYKFTATSKKQHHSHGIPFNQVLYPLDCPGIFYQTPSLWVNLYRHSLLSDHHIRFLETPGASYQDTSFVFKAYAVCKRFMLTEERLLNYRVDNVNSSVNSQDKVLCVCTEYREIVRFIKQYPEIYEQLKFHIPVLRFSCYSWNFARIHQRFKWLFLKAWQRDIVEDLAEGRINRQYLKRNQLKKIMLIRYFPLMYKWRRRKF
ncbi:glycosyltransferase [Neisseriaceae bacterium ESL0693]|nr:glycosyltransferase [Neisseriaceae bacterium ESL0693]